MQKSFLSRFSVIVIGFFFLSHTPKVDKEIKQTWNLDQVIEKYVAALGGYDKIKAIQNISYRGGTYQEGTYKSDGNSAMTLARPYYKLVGDKNNPGDYMEGYDGAAWEWFKDPGIVLRTVGPASAAIRHYAGVEGPLIDHREKGSFVKIIGETQLDEKDVVVVQLRRRDGFVEQFYIDTDTYLVIASSAEAPIHAFGPNISSITKISDYRLVSGIKIAHRFETIEVATGKVLSSMQWAEVLANQTLPANWFSPPAFDRSPLQAFIENLFVQRTDLQAIMWTYDEFRNAHKDLDTSESVNIAGYQILKMGEIKNAIALLERNTMDHPGSANAKFGLGRAYQRAKMLEEAQTEFLAALKIQPNHQRAKSALEQLSN